MARAKTAKVEPDPEPAGDMNQSQAIRAALAAGHETPATGVPFIKETYGLDIKPTSFSAVKANEKKKAGSAPSARRGRKPREKAEWPVAPVAAKPAGNGEADIIGALESLKPLVASIGADKVKRLVDLLG